VREGPTGTRARSFPRLSGLAGPGPKRRPSGRWTPNLHLDALGDRTTGSLAEGLQEGGPEELQLRRPTRVVDLNGENA
jgi:hypothetical protein